MSMSHARRRRSPVHDLSNKIARRCDSKCIVADSETIPERRSGKQVVKGGEKLCQRGGFTFKLPDAFQDLHKNLHSFTAIKTNACITNDLHPHTLHGLVAEAFNDLFAKHGKPEIAPAQAENLEYWRRAKHWVRQELRSMRSPTSRVRDSNRGTI